MDVAGGDVERAHELSLVLAQRLLLVGVRDLEEVARKQQVQVQRVFSRRAVVEAVEKARRVALVVQRGEFGRVEETARALEVKGGKITDLRSAVSKGGFGSGGPERAVPRQHTASRFLLAQAG